MLYRTIRNRLKIPNRVAATAALMIMFASLADPEQLQTTHDQGSVSQQDSSSSADETVNDLVGVAVTTAKPVNFNISKLIFRF